MRPENVRMTDYLTANNITGVRVKRILKGSLGGTWRLYKPTQPWSIEVAEKLNSLGFRDFDGRMLGRHSGNGGEFSVFVTGHDELA